MSKTYYIIAVYFGDDKNDQGKILDVITKNGEHIDDAVRSEIAELTKYSSRSLITVDYKDHSTAVIDCKDEDLIVVIGENNPMYHRLQTCTQEDWLNYIKTLVPSYYE